MNLDEIKEIVNNGSLSKSLLKKKYTSYIDQILNHNKELNISHSEKEEKFTRILQLTRKLTRDLKEELNNIMPGLYISVFQKAGKSIRRIGEIDTNFENLEFIPKSVFHLPETINRVIKFIRKINVNKAYIVIDAIRNPYEAKFFKDRYAAFHLVSINAPDEHRTKYLQKLHKYSTDQIKKLMKRSQGKVMASISI